MTWLGTLSQLLEIIVALALAPLLIRSAARIRSGWRALPDSA